MNRKPLKPLHLPKPVWQGGGRNHRQRDIRVQWPGGLLRKVGDDQLNAYSVVGERIGDADDHAHAPRTTERLEWKSDLCE